MPKKYLDKDVLTAARERVSFVFDWFEKVSFSFSGGKDSTVGLHLVMEEAMKRDREVNLLFIDMEAQYKCTIDHIEEMYEEYWDYINPYWVALPLSLRNAVSVYEPKWTCWDEDKKEKWIRTPPEYAITDYEYFDFFEYGMEFEEFVPKFNQWIAQKGFDGDGVGYLSASIVSIRSDESLNRYRTIANESKNTFHGKQWTTWEDKSCYSVYPIYDWRTEDVWRYIGKYNKPYNKIYDLMHQAGLSIHQARLCQPYGDDQRKGLWLYQKLEPETWAKVVARVNGANSGARYAQESGNINGTIKVKKPEGHTWETFSELLLNSMPESTAEHYRNKIAVFLNWWHQRGYENGIPDEADPKKENSRDVPSWRRIAKTLLRNDYWCKGLSFSQHKSDSYNAYKERMKKNRAKWNHLNDIVQ